MKFVELSECCEIIQGGRLKLSGIDFVERGFPAYGAGGMNGFLSKYEFDRDAIILSSIGARCGKCFLASGKWTSLANTQILLPDLSKADPIFLWYQLNDEGRWPRSGSAQPFIKPSDVKRHRIALPAISEQRRIAAILDQVDDLRRKRKTALAELERLVDVVFARLFGDPRSELERWPTVSFDTACRDETALSTKLQRGNYAIAGEYPVIDQGQSEIAGWTDDASLICSSKLPVVVFGDHTRTVKYVEHPFVIGADGAKVLVPSARYNVIFFAHLLRRLPIPDLGYSRHMREVKRLLFPCPPRQDQNVFASQVAKIEALKVHHRAHLARLDALFFSLQHRAFRGEL